MSTQRFNPDDPQLTAFALNELDAADREAVEKLLADSPEARAAFDEIQEAASLLRGELQAEPVAMLTDEQRSKIESQSDSGPAGDEPDYSLAAGSNEPPTQRKGRWIVPSLLATAASIAIIVPMLPRNTNDESLSRSETPAMSDTTGLDAVAMDDRFEASEEMSEAGSPDELLDGDVVALNAVAEHDESNLPVSNRTQAGFASTPGRATRNVGNTPAPESALTVTEDAGPGEKLNVVAKGKSANESSGKDDSFDSPLPFAGKQKTAQTSPVREARPADSKPRATVSRDRPNSASQPLASANSKNGDRDGSRKTEKSFAEKKAGEQSEAKGLAKRSSNGRPGKEAAKPANANPGAAGPQSLADSASGSNKRKMENRKRGGRPEVGAGALAGGRGLPRGGEGEGQQAGGRGVGGQFNPQGQKRPTTGNVESEASRVALAPGTPRRRPKDVSLEGVSESRDGRELKDQERLLQQTDSFRAFAGNEAYEPIVENAFITPDTEEKQLSTLSIDVDTAAYSNVRRFIMDQHRLPPRNAVRIEELINYFSYDYPQPADGKPFSVTTQVAACPWQPEHRLARIGLKAKDIAEDQRPQTNLVFLLDTSGSMRAQNKLPLVREAMKTLTEGMTEDDRIAIVTYSSTADLRLPSTLGSKQGEIIQVIDSLHAGGSTNGAGGIQLAYDTAIKSYIQGGSNRVILCTDGDFNVGISDDDQLVELIQEKAASGVFLSVFGFGIGNLKDAKLEKLADKGNGHYGYIDNLREASKVFGKELTGTLYTVAKDVKLQVEFNPMTVGAYRLIGYENRLLAAQDFTDDTKDAGEIGAGHTVTALYEVVPRATFLKRAGADRLRYQKAKDQNGKELEEVKFGDELLNVKLNYKKPDSEVSEGVSELIPVKDVKEVAKKPEGDFLFVASVASFGMNLRDSQYRGNWNIDDVLKAAKQSFNSDDEEAEEPGEGRLDFIKLVEKTKSILGPRRTLRAPAPARPLAPAVELSPAEARTKATVGGKYRRLVKRIEVRDDLQRFGGFYDYGAWDGNAYAGYEDLPKGNWVYVFPNWYIWAEVVGQPAEKGGPQPPEAEPPEPTTGSKGQEG